MAPTTIVTSQLAAKYVAQGILRHPALLITHGVEAPYLGFFFAALASMETLHTSVCFWVDPSKPRSLAELRIRDEAKAPKRQWW